MTFKYHLCVIILLNTQNTTESAKQIYIAWHTFILQTILNMKLFSLTNRKTVIEQILRWCIPVRLWPTNLKHSHVMFL